MTFTQQRSDAIRAGLIRAARHPSRRTAPLVVTGVTVAVIAAVAWFVVPGLPVDSGTRAVPASESPRPAASSVRATATSTPTTSVTPSSSADRAADLAALTVSTAGWTTYSSPEYPITFAYPPDWKVSYAKSGSGMRDGCDPDGCWLYVNPPKQKNSTEEFFVLLNRNGFDGYDPDGRTGFVTSFIAAVPDLMVWTSIDPATPPSTAAITSRSANGTCWSCDRDFGEPYDYMLSTEDFVDQLAVGAANPRLEQTAASFNFGSVHGVPKDQVPTVVTMLASARPNPDFKPTEPAKDNSGRPRFWMRSMDPPNSGVDSSTWETVTLPGGNISLRVPPRWKVETYPAGPEGFGEPGGSIYVQAPSGYSVVALTNGEPEFRCQRVTEWGPPDVTLGALPDVIAPGVDGTARQVDITWHDAARAPAEVRLLQLQSGEGTQCSQSVIDFGGSYPVSVGSADNSNNPTAAELDQAVAILASVERLHE